MWNFFKRQRKGNAVVALDLGAERIKAALFTIEERQNQSNEVIGKRAILKGFSSVAQEIGEGSGGNITDIASAIARCKEAIRLASQKTGILPGQLLLGVGGDSVKGVTSVETFEREDAASKINLAELHNIIHKLEWRAFAETRKTIAEEMGYPEIDMKLVNASIVETRIDGYDVKNPLGFQGREVQMSIFNSFAPLSHLGALRTITDHLELDLLGIVPQAYALARALGSEEMSGSSILIDVGGSTTDVAVLQGQVLRGIKTFALGGRTFTKRLAVELNIALKEAEKLKLSYTADKLEPKSKKIISDILKSDGEVWLEGIVLALSEFKGINELPTRILLSGGGSYLPQIQESLNNRKWYKKLPFTSTPQATLLKPTDLPHVIDENKRIQDFSNIVPAALVYLGIELAGEESLMEKTLRKVIGIMKV